MNSIIKKYLWVLPALYVSYEFGSKLFEVIADKQEFVDIISTIKVLAPISSLLAYSIGIFDFCIAIALLTCSLSPISKKYHAYIFMWAIIWPFVPSSLRYFTGISPFELVQVLSISIAALVSCVLYTNYNKQGKNFYFPLRAKK